jgi:hypothetical protein
MSRARFAIFGLVGLGCGASERLLDTRGTDVQPGPCGRGLVVLESDYQSSNVALVGFDGSVLSPSFAHSSARAAGYGTSLGGDAVPAGSATVGPNIPLVDRTPSGVLHFIDVVSSAPSFDLAVDTGFRSNPHDYLALAPNKAYVTRYEANPRPGLEPWDAGSDVLIVDPAAQTRVGRIDLSSALAGEDPKYQPHPDRLLATAGRVFVLLSAYAADYGSSAESRLIELDPESDAIVNTLRLHELHGCDALALAPSAEELAVACTGDQLAKSVPGPDGSGLVTVDIRGVPQEKQRFLAASFGAAPLGFGLDYAADGVILFSTLGYLDSSGQPVLRDTLLRLELAGGSTLELRSSAPFALGDVRCAPRCAACFVTDASGLFGSVLRYPLGDGAALGAPQSIMPEANIGLPARYLGAF